MSWWLLMLCYGLIRLVRWARTGNIQLPDERFVILWSLILLGTSSFAMMALLGMVWCIPIAAIGLVLLAPWRVIRYLCIPLGLVRPAYYLGCIAGWTWNQDLRGGALVAGAWALARQAPGSARGTGRQRSLIDWLERRRDGHESLQASHILATGLLAATRGDLAGARALLESVDEIAPRTTPRIVQALAREWLAAEAAGRGDWARVAYLAAGERGRTQITRLLGAVAGNLLAVNNADTGSTPGWRLWLLWLQSPHRSETWSLVRRAVAATTRPGEAEIPPARQLDTNYVGEAHREALAAHITLLRGHTGIRPADALRGVAALWDRALRTQRNAGGLDGKVDLRAELSSQVARDLAELALAHDLPIAAWSSRSLILQEVERLLREQLISEVELAFDALDDRLAERRELTPIDEWQEWLALRGLHRRAGAMGGIELRRLAFPRVHLVGCRLAVWLWNGRAQYLVANSIFRWLLDEALVVGDAEAIELQRRNWEERY